MKKLLFVLLSAFVLSGCGADATINNVTQEVTVNPSKGYAFDFLVKHDSAYVPICVLLWILAAVVLVHYVVKLIGKKGMEAIGQLAHVILIVLLSTVFQLGMVTDKKANLYKTVSKEVFEQHRAAGTIDSLFEKLK